MSQQRWCQFFPSMLQCHNTVSILEHNLEHKLQRLHRCRASVKSDHVGILKWSCDGKKIKYDNVAAEHSMHPYRDLAGILQQQYGRCQDDTVWLGRYSICPHVFLLLTSKWHGFLSIMPELRCTSAWLVSIPHMQQCGDKQRAPG